MLSAWQYVYDISTFLTQGGRGTGAIVVVGPDEYIGTVVQFPSRNPSTPMVISSVYDAFALAIHNFVF